MIDATSMHDVRSVEQPIGPRLRVARENADLTQASLARRLGVETGSVVAWENDERQPRANRLMMICGVLNVSLKFFPFMKLISSGRWPSIITSILSAI